MINVFSIGSSSSGNSYIIMAEGRTIILDAGLPAKKITGALEQLGTDPADVDAVLITHEHGDHVKSVRAVGRKCCSALFFASRGTIERAEGFRYIDRERLRVIRAGESFSLEGITIRAFALSHDAAEPVGYTVTAGGEKLAAVTDTGVVTEEIYAEIRDADMLIFEANHDEHMLMFGEYPYPLKVRIKSDRGHLSNDYAADVLARLMAERRAGQPEDGGGTGAARGPLRIMLAHLSFHNNMPLFARQTAEDRLTAEGFVKGTDYTLTVAAKEGLTPAD